MEADRISPPFDVFSLSPGTEHDVEEIMEVERQPRYDEIGGRWSLEQQRA